MLQALGFSLTGLVLLVLGALLMWKRKMPKFTALLWFAAGGAFAGGGLGSLLSMFLGLAGAIIGAGIGVLLFIVLLFVVVHDLWPKHKGAATRMTAVAALLLPIVAASVGGTIPGIVSTASHSLSNGASNLVSGAVR
jgi:hypothetical protein